MDYSLLLQNKICYQVVFCLVLLELVQNPFCLWLDCKKLVLDATVIFAPKLGNAV